MTILHRSALLIALPLVLSAGPVGADDAIAWHDIRTLTLEGRGWQDTKAPFDRLPSKAEGIVRPPVWSNSRNSAGICARFVTDAPEIHARWSVTSERLAMPHMAAIGVSGLDLYARDDEGRWRWVSVGQPTATTNTVSLVKGLEPVPREYLLYLPLYNSVSTAEIGVATGRTIRPGEPRPAEGRRPIVFYGTSITHGACASRPGMVHTAIIGRKLDVPIINLGFSGSGTMDQSMADLLVEIDAAVYVIDCLPNMLSDDIAARTGPLVRTLRRARPDTPILLVEDRSYTNGIFVERQRQRNATSRAALRTAYRRLLAEGVKGLSYLEGPPQLGDDGEGAVDSSHPNDLGFMRMADTFIPAIAPLLRRPDAARQAENDRRP